MVTLCLQESKNLNLRSVKMTNNKNISPEDQQSRYNWYLERVKERREWYGQLSQDLDKLVFSIASGTIVLSTTFIDKIVTIRNINHTGLLKMSWMLLGAALITNVLTFFTSMRETSWSKKQLDKWFDSNELKTPNLHGKLSGFTNFLNFFSVALLIIGIGYMGYFVSLNINPLTEYKMELPNNEKTTAPFSAPLPPPAQPAAPLQPQTTNPQPNSDTNK